LPFDLRDRPEHRSSVLPPDRRRPELLFAIRHEPTATAPLHAMSRGARNTTPRPVRPPPRPGAVFQGKGRDQGKVPDLATLVVFPTHARGSVAQSQIFQVGVTGRACMWRPSRARPSCPDRAPAYRSAVPVAARPVRGAYSRRIGSFHRAPMRCCRGTPS